MFLDFLRLDENFLLFMTFQHERPLGKTSSVTVPNYYKATKLFCQRNNLILNWKITSGMPNGSQAAATNDGSPTEFIGTLHFEWGITFSLC